MAVGVDRVAAERASRPARLDQGGGPLDERTSGAGGDPDQEHLVGFGLLEVLVELLRRDDGGLGVGEHLDHDPLGLRLPGEGHRAGPELLLDGLLERILVLEVEWRDGRDQRGVLLARHHLVEELVDTFGQHGDLLLLEPDARDAGSGACLEEEGALSGSADRAGHEALRRIESMNEGTHACHLMPTAEPVRRLRRPPRHDPAGRGFPGPPRRRFEPGQVTGVRVDRQDVGTGRRVADDRDRRRVDVDALEQVQVHPEGVGDDRLDDVAVADRRPDRVVAVLLGERRRRGAVRRRPHGPTSSPATHRRER